MIGMEEATTRDYRNNPTSGQKCEGPGKLPPVAIVMGRLVLKTEALLKTIEELRKRLNQVLRPTCQAEGPCEKDQAPKSSALVTDLEHIFLALSRADAEIMSLLQELEV